LIIRTPRRAPSAFLAIALLLSVLVALVLPGAIRATASASAGEQSAAPAAPAAPTDWSKALVESTMKRSTPSSFGGWGYTQGLYLWGQYLVYKRTGEEKYLTYIKNWADRFVDSSGKISNSFNNLDSMQSGNVLLALYQETHQARYKTAAAKIRKRLSTYPRTKDGGFWHGTSRAHQLWLDGTFMVLPFLVRYGNLFGDSTYANTEAVNQLLVYNSHLKSSTGLLYHAYDESGDQSWASSSGHHSPEFWCRAIGWYGMATTEVLEAIPAGQPKRDQ
jgi:unsaturated rhamnogalacturonyl hydrolase